MKIIICALLLLVIQGNVNGKPLLGSIIDTMHDIGCKIHDDGRCHPESGSTEQKQSQKTSFLGTVKQKVHGAIHGIGCAIKTHEGCLELTTTPSSRKDILSLIDLRSDMDSTTIGADNENVVFPSSDEIENNPAPKAIITVPYNCPSGYGLDRQNRCRKIE